MGVRRLCFRALVSLSTVLAVLVVLRSLLLLVICDITMEYYLVLDKKFGCEGELLETL